MTDLHRDISAASDEVTPADAPAPTEGPLAAEHVERAVELDASLDEVLAALSDPELLSAWLGAWTEDRSGATVRTDDGVLRRVTDRRWHTDGVEWRWHDDRDADAASTVRITLEPSSGGTRLVVRETACSTGVRATAAPETTAARTRAVVLDPAAWLANLLALGAVLAASSLVRV